MKKNRVAPLGATWAVCGAVVLALALPNVADAKRLGGGGSAGRSAPAYSMPAKPANNSGFGQGAQGNAATPAGASSSAAQSSTAAKPPAAAAAQAPKRNWMGPVMGIAAGLGLAALFSSMGLGAGLAQVLSVLLMAVAAVAVVALLLRVLRGGRSAGRSAGRSPGLAYQGAGAPGVQDPLPPLLKQPQSQLAGQLGHMPTAAFDTPSFLSNAKQFFVTLQGLNDAGNWQELRRYCTEDLWQHFVQQGQERPMGQQCTEVMKLDAELLDMQHEGAEQVAAVSYTALVREDETSLPTEIREVWTLVRPQDASSGWVLAGIHAA